MLKGVNYIGFEEVENKNGFLQSYNPNTTELLPEKFSIATTENVDEAVSLAQQAFEEYKKFSGEKKAEFLDAIAAEIDALGPVLIERAQHETGLPEARLTGERGRTTGQLKMFAQILREGSWVEAVIDEAMPERQPLPRADLRKMLVPIGPVAVFGASNFPFAFSTAGGDTASALAAGNPVIVKAHSSHLGTNEMVASAILKAAKNTGMPNGIFSFVIGEGATIGIQLVTHKGIQAVGFTGSYKAGMNIFKAAINNRDIPIPVYAEMSSINPILVLPQAMETDKEKIATQLSTSITMGVGQFCTNPGLIFVLETEHTNNFVSAIQNKIEEAASGTMLNENICKSYYENLNKVSAEKNVETLAKGKDLQQGNKGTPALLQTNAPVFIKNQNLQTEIFGPASLIVRCADKDEMQAALAACHGQLTGSVMATEQDLQPYATCIKLLQSKVGRIIFNGVPTGVEVCNAMVHGGPYPSTSNQMHTSVGADAIKRFVRPVCFQDCPEHMLPPELKNNNPLKIMRKINGVYTLGK